MNRLLASSRTDFRVQWRNGFYMVSLIAALLIILIIRNVFTDEQIHSWLPIFFFLAISGTSFFFLSGQILFEKGEGILFALRVTPLRRREYLLSKLITLTGLALLEAVFIAVAVSGVHLQWFWFALGVILLSVMYILIGFLFIPRYDSISDFLIPASLFISFLQLPVFYDLGLMPWNVFLLWPVYAPVWVIKAAFMEVDAVTLFCAIGYSLLWMAVFWVWGSRVVERRLFMEGRA